MNLYDHFGDGGFGPFGGYFQMNRWVRFLYLLYSLIVIFQFGAK